MIVRLIVRIASIIWLGSFIMLGVATPYFRAEMESLYIIDWPVSWLLCLDWRWTIPLSIGMCMMNIYLVRSRKNAIVMISLNIAAVFLLGVLIAYWAYALCFRFYPLIKGGL